MKLKRILAIVLCVAMVLSTMGFSVFAEEVTTTTTGNVAKVGNTEYATIDEAIANWTNGTTLTLLSNVTLSDVITLKSTEHHILNLGTYTMTAASGKNAFVIQACGTGSAERTAITINADATNPGGINAGSKCVVYYKYADGGISGEDRPIIKINGGVFTGSASSWGTAGIYTTGTAARKCATTHITGGTFNCSINGSGKSKLIISGGTFNYSVGSQGDSTALRLISGGTFKSFGFMTADDNNTKFWIGTSMGNSNVGAYIDDNGYLVVGGPVITDAGEYFEASSANYGGFSSYLKYSSAATEGLYYTSVEEAFVDNNKSTGSVTVYVDKLDMTNKSYKGTIVVPEGETIIITTNKGTTPTWKVSASEDAVTYIDAETGKELVVGEDGAFAPAESEISTGVIVKGDIEVDVAIVEGTDNSYDITLKEGEVWGEDTSVEITFPAAENAQDGDMAYVVHEHNGARYIYVGTVESGTVTVINTVGFSTFTVYEGGLAEALNDAAAGTGSVTVEILSDIDLTGFEWTPVTVSAPGYPVVTVNGNDKTITGLNNMLFGGTWAGGSGLIINDLTIKDSTIVNDENDSKGTVGVGAFVGFPQASKTITLNNCHLVSSTVKGGHWTGGLVGYAAGYAGTDGPVFMNLTINNCSVTGSTIEGKGSAGGIIGHASGNAWTKVEITNTTVSGNTVKSTGSSTNKAGSVVGTIGAAGQSTTVNGVEKTGGVSVDATVSDNTVTSNGTSITTIYGRQGSGTGMLYITGGVYDNYPIEENVSYAAPMDGYKINDNGNGTYGIEADPTYGMVAKIGATYFRTLTEAISAAQAGDEVEILVAGTYNVPTGKNITVTGAVDGVVFDNIGECNMGGASVTFNNVTFNYTNAGYKGLQHSGDLVYNNCTFNGVVFLYGTSETFNNCTFNVSGDAYNVWTYSAPIVKFEGCTFNSSGKSVLIYRESAPGFTSNVEVVDCDFIADGSFDGKAAIEMDSSLFDGIKLTIDGETTVTGFEEGSVSGSNLWNNKKGNEGANNDITVIVDGEVVLEPYVPVAKIGEQSYTTFADALNAVADGQTITLLDITGDESGTEIEFTKDISFTITGKAPNYALPIVTFQNADVTIKDAEILIPELDARQNATINVVDSIVRDAGGNSIVKSYYNGAINISGTSVVYTMQVTTMGYITISDTAKLNATWQANVYGNGLIIVEDDAELVTAALQLTGKEYSGRDNTDTDRVGKPATVVVDGATLTIGKVYSDSGADYSYNSSYGINVGTIAGKSAVLDAKNGANVNIYMDNGQSVNIGADGTVNVADSSLITACRAADGTVTLANNGTVNVSGTSDIAAKVTGGGIVYMDGVTLDADTKLYGAKVRFASGTNEVNGSVIDDGSFQVGIGAYNGTDSRVDTVNSVTVNVKNDAKIGSTDGAYAGWIGTGYYDTDAEKAAVMTGAKYVLNIDNSIAEFGYLHISNDGELNVKGNASEKVHYNNSDYSFRGGDFIINGTATFDSTDVLAFYTKVSCDNGTDKPGTLNIVNGTYYEAERHNGAVNGTNFVLYKTGVVNVNNAELYIGEYTSIASDAVMNIGGEVTALGTITNNGTINLTDINATLATPEAPVVNSTVEDHDVVYTDGKYIVNKVSYVAQIGDVKYETVAKALEAAKAASMTDVTITLIGETTKDSAMALEDAFNLYTLTAFDSVTFKQEDASKEYYIDGIYTGKRNNGGTFVFDGVNIVVTGQYIFEGNVKLIGNSTVKSVAEANCFIYNGTTTVEAGSKLKGVIDQLRGGTLIVDGGRTDGTFNDTPDMQDSILSIMWSGDSMTVENGAYVKVNAANEVGRVSVYAGTSLNVNASKFEAWQWIDNAGTINADMNSSIVTKKITGAGTISIDATGFDGTPVQVITADISAFTGTVSVMGDADYEITDTGLVIVPMPATPVASVNGVEYESLAEAFAVGGDIKLLQNVAIDTPIKVTSNTTLDLNGKTITGTDNATSSFGLIEIQPGAELTINDTTGEGAITLTATNNRAWNAYSSVISNQRGKLTVNGGTIEHLGGTDMAYGIDNLTNGKGTYAETIINGGTIKSTYRGIRQFLNGVEAQNILTVNGGTVEGANKSIWMQDANANANPGKLTVTNSATLNGDVYLFVTEGSTEWPVEVSIAAAAVNGEVLSANVPDGYEVVLENDCYGVQEKAEETETLFKDTLLFVAGLADEVIDGVTYHPVYVATSIDSLNYRKVGFDYVFSRFDPETGEVTFTAPYTTETSDVYDSISDATTTYTVDSIGGNGEYLFMNKLLFNKDYYHNNNTKFSITPYAIDLNGNKITGWTIDMTNEFYRSLQSGGVKVDMFKEGN